MTATILLGSATGIESHSAVLSVARGVVPHQRTAPRHFLRILNHCQGIGSGSGSGSVDGRTGAS